MTSRVDQPPAYTEPLQNARNAILSHSNYAQNVDSAPLDGLPIP
jgi:hypothetical protein